MIDAESIEGFHLLALKDRDDQARIFILIPYDDIPVETRGQMVSGVDLSEGHPVYHMDPLVAFLGATAETDRTLGFARLLDLQESGECIIGNLIEAPKSFSYSEPFDEFTDAQKPPIVLAYEDYFLADYIARSNTHIDAAFVYFMRKCVAGAIRLIQF
ncbi:hypothetical protein [Brevibacterium sp. UCMA 11752]|uniref:hypothetical protein n=1 Tax=Brevibacterium sp. UCMA 11752 TaxID=2745946 RepID=UPI001F261751|nr:hypothetical protein [Brevibacterium sp. UCMA 11752]MCF2587744.1 hypothetical protein [Brevibacterium sp. UCMA 11752]